MYLAYPQSECMKTEGKEYCEVVQKGKDWNSDD